MIVAGLCLLLLSMAVAPAVCAQTDSPAPKRSYKVNKEHIERLEAEREQPSRLSKYIKTNLAEESLLHKFYFLLYMLMPFAILGISLWIDITDSWDDINKLFMLGLSEFVFGVGNAGIGAGAYPWFCDFDIVGWIVTILCFCYMLRLLVKQTALFLYFVNSNSDGRLMKKLLYYAIYLGIAVSVTMLLAAKPYFWLAPIVVGGAWYCFYRYEYGDSSTATRMLVYTGVIFGGFVIFLLQVIGMILVVALVLFLLNGLDSIKTSSVDADDDAPSSSEGMLERAADGTPFVHHRDGSTTQLKDNGDGTFNDGSGNNWSGNGSGSLFR